MAEKGGDIMADRRGREKNITGESKDISRRGEGLGTGKVGKTDSKKRTIAKKIVKKAALAVFEKLAK